MSTRRCSPSSLLSSRVRPDHDDERQSAPGRDTRDDAALRPRGLPQRDPGPPRHTPLRRADHRRPPRKEPAGGPVRPLLAPLDRLRRRRARPRDGRALPAAPGREHRPGIRAHRGTGLVHAARRPGGIWVGRPQLPQHRMQDRRHHHRQRTRAQPGRRGPHPRPACDEGLPQCPGGHRQGARTGRFPAHRRPRPCGRERRALPRRPHQGTHQVQGPAGVPCRTRSGPDVAPEGHGRGGDRRARRGRPARSPRDSW